MSKLEELVENIKTNVNLMHYAETHYGFHFVRSGKVWMSACKLKGHSLDKTPSFAYNEEKNTYKCYGCDESGSIIDLVGNMESIEPVGQGFFDILKLICDNEGIEFNVSSRPPDPEAEAMKEAKTKLAIAYQKYLWENKSSYGFQYLLSRGLTENTISNFYLGLTSANESRYKLSGISNRICIPIFNANGDKVIACSFRQLDDNETERKYKHDATDKIWNKEKVFYGWSHALKHIREHKHVYVVEGYFDMISLYQLGIKNVVAMMTNRMTESQIELLSKYVKNVTLILDQDEAGAKGFQATIATMLNKGMNVRVVPNLGFKGKDMNDVCVKFDWDRAMVESLLNSNAKDAVMYLMSSVLEKYDEIMFQARDRVMRASTAILSCVQDPIKKANMEAFVNTRIGVK
jgi:DNA primase